jgi:RHS repeat-associated protein
MRNNPRAQHTESASTKKRLINIFAQLQVYLNLQSPLDTALDPMFSPRWVGRDNSGRKGLEMARWEILRRGVGKSVGYWSGLVAWLMVGCGGVQSELVGTEADALTCVDGSAAQGAANWSNASHQYAVGNLVTYKGQVYECIKANTSSSSATPTARTDLWLIPPSCALAEWQPQTGYDAGQVVDYQGQRYTAKSANTATTSNAPGTSQGASTWSALKTTACPADDSSVFDGDDIARTPSGEGSTPGAFSTLLNGSAAYQIPIVTPPGRAGIEPRLSLAYDSSVGDGLLGAGATIGGLSLIVRCAQNLSDDNALREVRFDNNDAFCLDGSRLVRVGGSSSKPEYRTEPDTFRKVIAQFGAGADVGPTNFQVLSRDGRIAEYGGRIDSAPGSDATTSRVMANGGVVAKWALSRVSDRFGNFLDISYINVPTSDGDGDYTAQYMPNVVRYTGHSAADGSTDADPQRSIQFFYEQPRYTVLDGYLHGLHVFAPELVSRIEVSGPGGLARKYALTYEPGGDSPDDTTPTVTGKDRLKSITESDSIGTAKVPTTLIHGTFGAATTFQGDAAFTPADTGFARYDITPTDEVHAPFNVVADLDGNGVDEIISVTRQLSGSSNPTPVRNRLRVLAQRFVGAPHPPDVQYDRGLRTPTESLFTPLKQTFTWDSAAVVSIVPLDYDGDGLRDLMIVEEQIVGAPHTLKWMRTSIDPAAGLSLAAPADTGVELPTTIPYFADVNGDGVSDLIMCGTGSDGTSWEARVWHAGDSPFDTPTSIDGLHGLPCSFGDALAQDGAGSTNAVMYQGAPSYFAAFDTNGDGADDLLVPADPTDRASKVYAVRWDFANNTFTDRLDTNLTTAAISTFRALDLNGDGLQDLISFPNVNPSAKNQPFDLDVHINTGDGFLAVPASGASDRNFGDSDLLAAVVLDADGDGREDILIPSRTTSHWEVLSWASPTAANGVAQTGFLHRDTTILKDGFAQGSMQRVSTPYSSSGVIGEWLGTETAILFTSTNDPVSDLVTAIQDQVRSSDETLGHIDGISYDFARSGHTPVPLAQGEFGYLGDSGCAFPMLCPRGYRPLATKYTTINASAADTISGEPDMQPVRISYREARGDALGRGWLGYGQVRMEWLGDPAHAETWLLDNTVLEGPNEKRFPHAGFITDHWLTLADPKQHYDGTHTHITRTLQAIPRSNGAETFSFLESERDDENLTGVTFDTSVVPSSTVVASTVTTTTPLLAAGVPDEAGNVADILVTNPGLTRQIETTFEYEQEDTSAWLVGLPTHVTTVGTEAVNGNTQTSTRELRTKYASGLPTDEIMAPGVADRQLWTTYTRDTFGNATLVQTTGLENGTQVTRQRCVAFDANESMFPAVTNNALGQLARVKYDRDLGLPLQQLDINGLTTKWGYDGFGRLTEELKPDQSHTTISRIGSTETLDDTAGHDTELVYDSAGRMILRRAWHVGQEDPMGPRTNEAWAYNSFGSVSEHLLPYDTSSSGGLSENFYYDGISRLHLHVLGSLAQFTADYHGLETDVASIQQQAQITTDAAGRVQQVQPLGHPPTTYVYGPFDHLLSVTDPLGQSDPKHVRSADIDAYGFARSITSPDSGTHQFTFSAFGQMTTETVAGSTKTYSYDALGRMTQLVDDDGTTQWQWDSASHGVGKLAGVLGPAANTALGFTYDSGGRLASESTQDDVDSATITYGYDNQGRLGSIQYPSGAGTFTINYGYDHWGILSSATNADDGTVFWNLGQADAASRPNIEQFADAAIQRTQSFDDQYGGALKSIKTAAGSTGIQDLAYTYGVSNELRTRTDNGGWSWQGKTADVQVESFCYDSLTRLTDIDVGSTSTDVCGGSEFHYEYDDDGSITKKSDVGSYSYDPNHVHAVKKAGSDTYTYDDRGDQITRPRGPDEPSGLVGSPTVHYTALNLPQAIVSGDVVGWTASSTKASAACGETAGIPAVTATPSIACLIATTSLAVTDYTTMGLDAAAGSLDLASHATIDGNVAVSGAVTLHDNSTITGRLDYSGTIKKYSGVTVGLENPTPGVSVPVIPTQSVSAGTGNPEVGNGITKTLTPGKYGNETFRAGSKVTMGAGTYNFLSLHIEGNSTVKFDTSGGQIQINVVGDVTFDSGAIFKGGPGLKVALYTNGCSVFLNGTLDFPGTITAPHAAVTMQSGAKVDGCVWGRSVTVGPHTDAAIATKSVGCSIVSQSGKNQVACSDNLDTFRYDGSGSRVGKTTHDEKIFYASGAYQRIHSFSTGNVTHRYYVLIPGGPVAVISRTRDSKGKTVGSDTVHYLFTDNLHSLDVATDETGDAIDRRGYDPFGQRRGPRSNLTTEGALDPMMVGFAGHEDDPEFGLVNMRGRVYDPRLGRFLSADPIVGKPLNTQAWNPYSYVRNNPLSLLDRLGFDPEDDELQADYEIVITATRIYGPYTWDLGLANPWGGLRHIDALEFVNPLNDAVYNTVHNLGAETARKGTEALAVMAAPGVAPAAIAFVETMGLRNPDAANAPVFGRPTVPEQSTAQRVFQVAVPVILGGVAKGPFGAPTSSLGPEGEEIASVLQEDTGPASSSINGPRLADDLVNDEASSAFTETGELSQEAVAGSKEIIPADKLINDAIPPGFSKYSTETFQSPSGPFQVHYYMDSATGEIYYGMDYKAVMNNGIVPFVSGTGRAP